VLRGRVQVSGGRHAQDTLRVATRNAAGQTTGDAWYGGYFHQIGTGPWPTSLCRRPPRRASRWPTNSASSTWGPLGELTQETYPRCATGLPCAGLAAARIQSYSYDRGDLTVIGGWGSLSYHDNGMLAAATHSNGVIDSIDKDPWQMSRPILESFFLYDAYGRLRTWNDRSGKSQDFDFDAFGNLIKITDFDGLHPPTSRNFAVSQTTNQLTALVAYDRRGNLTHRGLGSVTETYQWYLFDQLGAQNVPAVTHLYTADGERVWTLRFNSANRQLDETFTLRGLGNQVMTVYRHQANSLTGLDQWSWEEDYIYRGSQLFAKATSKAAPFDKVHFTLDHLGTPRVATGSHGPPVEGYHYLPFGEQHGGTLGSSERMRYTGHERDQNASGTADDLDHSFRECAKGVARQRKLPPSCRGGSLRESQRRQRSYRELRRPRKGC
jgi:YD repeat-containing protein